MRLTKSINPLCGGSGGGTRPPAGRAREGLESLSNPVSPKLSPYNPSIATPALICREETEDG